MKLALAVHGGAWDIPAELVEPHRAGVTRALERGWEILTRGGSALAACEAAVTVMEDDPTFDAGIGSHLNRAGCVQLDAILMDGLSLKAGAIAVVERIRNPIQVARLVLEHSEHMMLVGAGAERFASEMGVKLCDPSELVVTREQMLWSKNAESRAANGPAGTVGAVALDAKGNVAAGTSTGGPPHKYPGRIGDSPLIGCGCYADNRAGAISTTGWGEAMMKVVMAKTASDLLGTGLDPQAVAEKALALLAERTAGTGGLIIVDRQGRVGAAFTTPRMAYAFRSSDTSPTVRS